MSKSIEEHFNKSPLFNRSTFLTKEFKVAAIRKKLSNLKKRMRSKRKRIKYYQFITQTNERNYL